MVTVTQIQEFEVDPCVNASISFNCPAANVIGIKTTTPAHNANTNYQHLFWATTGERFAALTKNSKACDQYIIKPLRAAITSYQILSGDFRTRKNILKGQFVFVHSELGNGQPQSTKNAINTISHPTDFRDFILVANFNGVGYDVTISKGLTNYNGFMTITEGDLTEIVGLFNGMVANNGSVSVADFIKLYKAYKKRQKFLDYFVNAVIAGNPKFVFDACDSDLIKLQNIVKGSKHLPTNNGYINNILTAIHIEIIQRSIKTPVKERAQMTI